MKITSKQNKENQTVKFQNNIEKNLKIPEKLKKVRSQKCCQTSQ